MVAIGGESGVGGESGGIRGKEVELEGKWWLLVAIGGERRGKSSGPPAVGSGHTD